MQIKKIKTDLSAFEIFSIFKDYPHVVFLDSGGAESRLSGYSFISFKPLLTFESKNNTITLIRGKDKEVLKANPFEELKKLMDQYASKRSNAYPFMGGFLGYFGYDLCHAIESLPRQAKDDIQIPDCFLGLYDGVIIYDHAREEVILCAEGLEEDPHKIISAIEKEILESTPASRPQAFLENDPVLLQSNMSKQEYIQGVERVKAYIRSGDVYQANMTRRFNCPITVPPFDLYYKLRTLNPAPFSAYVDFGEGHLISSSPERFIQVKNRKIETRPIKGTLPRGETPEEDERLKNELANSFKDQSELLMIVDLERNDIGKIAKIGSVQVPELFKIESYATVHHLVSTVTGELRDDVHPIEAIKAMFPGGSITGAPKIKAMSILDELEPTQRSVYTGSIGYIDLNGDIDLNIVIRTMISKGNEVFFQVGGGIVWDSQSELEYEETLHKAKALMKTLNASLE